VECDRTWTRDVFSKAPRPCTRERQRTVLAGGRGRAVGGQHTTPDTSHRTRDRDGGTIGPNSQGMREDAARSRRDEGFSGEKAIPGLLPAATRQPASSGTKRTVQPSGRVIPIYATDVQICGSPLNMRPTNTPPIPPEIARPHRKGVVVCGKSLRSAFSHSCLANLRIDTTDRPKMTPLLGLGCAFS
jgi:hypothetical protein